VNGTGHAARRRRLGAFRVYPYAGADAERHKFVQEIEKVGGGGVPFLPSRRGEVTKPLKRIIAMSADAVEDTAVELSTVEERQRIGWAHEYGLIAFTSGETFFKWSELMFRPENCLARIPGS